MPLRNPPGLPAPVAPSFSAVFSRDDCNGVSLDDFDTIMSGEQDPFTSEEHYMDNDELLCREIELLHLLALEPEPEQEEDDTIPRLLDELNDIDDLDGPEDEEDMARIFGATLPNYNYAPYQNKMMCFIDILDNRPHLRLSSSQIKMVL
ncbi:hypothetical protein B0H10DRAFT_2209777 [Mycena sp. CBHHK59/15]|nr:hypothetical protein B0H10DRAFT_2209777 [Mycena sp. CBHHK59/15]